MRVLVPPKSAIWIVTATLLKSGGDDDTTEDDDNEDDHEGDYSDIGLNVGAGRSLLHFILSWHRDW